MEPSGVGTTSRRALEKKGSFERFASNTAGNTLPQLSPTSTTLVFHLGRNFRKSTTLFGSGGCVDDPQLFADGDLIRFVSDHVRGRCRASEASVPARDQPKLSAARGAARKNATRIFLNRRRP